MKLQTEADILALIEAEPFHRSVLELAREQQLKDWWIGAGFEARQKKKNWPALWSKLRYAYKLFKLI